MITNKAGAWGEIYAARYLRKKEHDVISSNYVCRFGELDIVSLKDGIVCITEVKTRNKNTLFRPMEAVDEGKRQRIEMAAKSFIKMSKLTGEIRFDVCEVYIDDNFALVDINYIENAF